MDCKVVVFLGPPGSGKGTQAARICSKLEIPAISTGEILRRECASGSDLGKQVQNVLASGKLVDDTLMNQVVASRLSQTDCVRGCILDGYPRTVSQARYLDSLLATLGRPKPVVIDFYVSAEEIISRLTHRRQCPKCGGIFSFSDSTIQAEHWCDRDGTKLIQRSDDNPTTIHERIKLYERNVDDLVAYYRAGAYHRVSGARTPVEITSDVLGLLASDWAAPVRVPQPAYRVQSANAM
jgi:adenylate kinase